MQIGRLFLVLLICLPLGCSKKETITDSHNSLTVPGQFRCSGKIYCSQMTSCQEALYYLKNCPGVEIDGDGDKVPCEKEWCGHTISNAHHF